MKISYLIILGIIATFSIGVDYAFGDSEQVEKTMTDYVLKGKAYDYHGHEYMAFLNYDKGHSGSKDSTYNNVQKYKDFIKECETDIEFCLDKLSLINRSYDIGDYQGTIIYSEMAEESNLLSISPFDNRIKALIFLQRHDEASLVYERQLELEATYYDKGSVLDVLFEMQHFYRTGNYQKAVDKFENWLDEGGVEFMEFGYSLGISDTALLAGMNYEKTGDIVSAFWWYDEVSYLENFELGCLKSTRLLQMGMYDELIRIMEKDNRLETCYDNALWSYVIAKDFVTGQYHPIIDRNLEFDNSNQELQQDDLTNQKLAEDKGGGCLIATATYGSELAPQVQQLRELRDNKLLQTESGSAFMESFNDFYYSFSPGIADYERENPVFKETVKLAITPMISSLSILNNVNMDSEAEVLGYGISLILLNVGMYVGVPAIVIMRIRNGII